MLTPHQGFTYNKFEKPNDWPQLDKTFDYKYNNGKLVSGNEHIYLAGPVTYTKVGNPTIKDNIVSGFSTSNYLKSGGVFDFSQPFEVNISVKDFEGTGGSQYVFGLSAGSGGTLTHSLGMYHGGQATGLSMSYGNNQYWTSLAPTLTSHVPYTINLSSNGTTVTAKVTQGNKSKTSTKSLSDFATTGTCELRLGLWATYGQVFSSGSIDLNETYIKINNQLFFYGKIYSTKDKAAVPAGLEYNNTTTPSIGWVNTDPDKVKGPVTYTIQGSPTIVNGVASGFSATDYLTISNFSNSTPFELVIRTKYNSFSGSAKYLFSFSGMYILQDSNTSIYCSIQKSDGTYVYPGFGSGLLPDTFYYLKLVYDGTTLWAGRSTDGTTYTETYNQNATLYSRTGNIYLAFRSSTTGTWDGSIDLNETYIKVNGKTWFGTTPSEFQQFTAAPAGVTIGKDETEMLQVDGGKIVGSTAYKIEGSPTITNGIVSGFSDSNYIQTSENSNDIANKDFEMQAKVIATANNSDGPVLCVPNAYLNGIFISSRKPGFAARVDGESSNLGIYCDTLTVSGSTYIINVKRANNIITVKLYKDGDLVETKTQDITGKSFVVRTDKYTIGRFNFGYLASTNVDLNETYIKVNNALWFGKDTWTPSTYTDNAIYLLGSHSTDYSNYNTLEFTPTVSDDANYDVWIDNQKLFENENGGTSINWQNLGLATGYSITTPSTLKAHTIKIVPTNSLKSLLAYKGYIEPPQPEPTLGTAVTSGLHNKYYYTANVPALGANGTNSWEIKTRVNLPASHPKPQWIIGNDDGHYTGPQLFIKPSGQVGVYASSNGTSFDITNENEWVSATYLTYNKIYDVSLGFNTTEGYYITIQNIDGYEPIKEKVSSTTTKINCTSNVYFLDNVAGDNMYFNSVQFFDYTKITINGSIWFDGATAVDGVDYVNNGCVFNTDPINDWYAYGGLTITDGIASGFEETKYVRYFGNMGDTYETNLFIKTPGSFGDDYYIIGNGNTSPILRFNSHNSYANLYAVKSGTSYNGVTQLQPNTNYIIKIVSNGTDTKIYTIVNSGYTKDTLPELSNWTIEITTSSADWYRELLIGGNGNGLDFPGTIDLNNSCVITGGSEHTLPEGFTQLNYVQSTGSQRVDLGIHATLNSKAKLKLNSQYIGESGILGQAWALNGFFLMFYNNQLRWHGADAVDVPVSTDTDYVVEVSNGNLNVDGTNYTCTPSSTLTENHNIEVFSLSDTGSGGSFKLYYLEWYENNTLTMQLTPVQRTRDSVHGLYDVIGHGFYPSILGNLLPG